VRFRIPYVMPIGTLLAANFEFATSAGPSPSDNRAAAALQAAIAYVTRCLRGDRPFAVATAANASSLAPLLDRVAGDFAIRQEVHVLRIGQPTDHVPDFIGSCLGQLGLEAPNAEPDELHNLLLVFLRHEAANGRKTVFQIEDTEQFGPRILDFLQALSRVRVGATAPALFLLTGSPVLHRVLDSPAMAALKPWTRERFDMDRGVAWVAAPPVSATPSAHLPPLPRGAPEKQSALTPRMLVVMQDGQVVERRALRAGRLFVGRTEDNDLVLPSLYVSRRHAVLLIADGGAYVVDMRSRNGTQVNGRTITDEALEPGDLIGIGNYRLGFEIAGPSGSVS
jgi:hypothetical protein